MANTFAEKLICQFLCEKEKLPVCVTVYDSSHTCNTFALFCACYRDRVEN